MKPSRWEKACQNNMLEEDNIKERTKDNLLGFFALQDRL